MTSQEKAEQLVFFYQNLLEPYLKNINTLRNKSIQCALIAVDEIIAELAYIRNYDEEIDEKMIIKIDQRQEFLIEVEKEIKKL